MSYGSRNTGSDRQTVTSSKSGFPLSAKSAGEINTCLPSGLGFSPYPPAAGLSSEKGVSSIHKMRSLSNNPLIIMMRQNTMTQGAITFTTIYVLKPINTPLGPDFAPGPNPRTKITGISLSFSIKLIYGFGRLSNTWQDFPCHSTLDVIKIYGGCFMERPPG